MRVAQARAGRRRAVRREMSAGRRAVVVGVERFGGSEMRATWTKTAVKVVKKKSGAEVVVRDRRVVKRRESGRETVQRGSGAVQWTVGSAVTVKESGKYESKGIESMPWLDEAKYW
jgi:hypothetical protein